MNVPNSVRVNFLSGGCVFLTCEHCKVRIAEYLPYLLRVMQRTAVLTGVWDVGRSILRGTL